MLTVFGETTVVRVGIAETTISGVITRAFEDKTHGDMLVDMPLPFIDYDSAAFAATGAREGDSVFFDGLEYTIKAIRPDDGGMTRVEVSFFA
jgi:hypothetical protein